MKVISVKKETILMFFYIVVIVFGVAAINKDKSIATFAMPVSRKVIIIDAGHGGFDPGKVASGNVLEKDINLQIALKLQAYLEQGGSTVLLTRSDDKALGEKKGQDMQARKSIANNTNADMLISIHQNAYESSEVYGTQVFYFGDSEKSKLLATSIQTEIKSFLKQKGKLEAKSNSNYFVLKQTLLPAVIVECGFLTNPSDKQKLTQDEYQEKMAWGIYKGIITYFEAQ